MSHTAGCCPHCGSKIRTWTRPLMIQAGRRFVEENDRPPRAQDWNHAAGRPSWAPSTAHAARKFGSWAAYVKAIGCEPGRRWHHDGLLEAMILWRETHGDWPTTHDWKLASDKHPAAWTVYTYFKSWAAAMKAARARLNEQSPYLGNVPGEPIREAVERWVMSDETRSTYELSRVLGMDDSRLRRVLQQERLTREVADRILACVDAVELWHIDPRLRAVNERDAA